MANVAELNAAQAEWMAVDSNGPKAEVDRVCALYGRVIPKNHIVISKDGRYGNVNFGSHPAWPSARPIGEVKAYAKASGVRADVAWCGHLGKWVNLSS